MIDPIKVAEARERDEAEARAAGHRIRAADALLWFKEYAEGRPINEVLRLSVSLVAGSTPRAREALSFVSNAAEQILSTILADAIIEAERAFEDTPRRQALREMVEIGE
ncbi:hypothetical protein KNJ79_05055 [Sphingopyxis indica]|uniref:hypothetical protein n=1 Tax=Sphingopyxis indica TaxID=436663 RepID=UPI00293926D1|nr:hypothetical protein [Sphingopyxis indica]WOF44300.1 hypothetical protein KNJ79_05055 [Sphingopyxis indica]